MLSEFTEKSIWYVASLLDELDPLSSKQSHTSPAPTAAPPVLKSRTPQSFLGENSALVNLDNLIKPTIPNSQTAFGGVGAASGALGAAYSNPFGESSTGTQPKTNLFQQQTQPVSVQHDHSSEFENITTYKSSNASNYF